MSADIEISIPELFKKFRGDIPEYLMVGGKFTPHAPLKSEIVFQRGFRPFNYPGFLEASRQAAGKRTRPRGQFYAEPPSPTRKHKAAGTIVVIGKYESKIPGRRYEVNLFYGTDRKQENPSSPNTYFGSKPGSGEELEVGTCRVNIPLAHRPGTTERPRWWKLRFKENHTNDIMLVEVKPLRPKDYFIQMRHSLESTYRDLLVFIHGFNVSFAEAARRTAQVVFDLGFDGTPVFFSWPSKVRLLAYVGDDESVAWSAPHLAQFLHDLIRNARPRRIHVLAHSMGSQLLLAAATRQPIFTSVRDDQEIEYCNLIFAAPDVGRRLFKQEANRVIGQKGRSGLRRFTLYSSRKDIALKASKSIHGPDEERRAGEGGGDQIFTMPGLDSVDASECRTDLLGHGHFSSSVKLLTDLYMLIARCLSPSARGLCRRKKSCEPYDYYYQFPEKSSRPLRRKPKGARRNRHGTRPTAAEAE